MASETSPSQTQWIPVELCGCIDEVLTHYPISRRSAVLPILHLWQNHFGYIDGGGIEWIASKLGMQPIQVLELVAFYPWFRQEKTGRIMIRVCHTLSCAMAGSQEVHEAFCRTANISVSGDSKSILTSADGKFSIEFVECLASCGTAPVCLIQDDLVEKISPKDAPDILKQYA